VDLDKTIARYDGWVSRDHIGEPLPGAREFLQTLVDQGWYIIIFSARAEEAQDCEVIKKWVRDWFPFIPESQQVEVTNVKLREFECFVDDRAIPFYGDYHEALVYLNQYILDHPKLQEVIK
jgi:hypothetical protein